MNEYKNQNFFKFLKNLKTKSEKIPYKIDSKTLNNQEITNKINQSLCNSKKNQIHNFLQNYEDECSDFSQKNRNGIKFCEDKGDFN